MLKKVKKRSSPRDPLVAMSRFVIVASRYNSEFVEPMIKGALAEFRKAGVRNIDVLRVPGAYEIPLVAQMAAKQTSPEAIICLGIILRGETVHAAHIGDAVSRALMEIQLKHDVPVIHEVLLLENKEQARVRCKDPRHNRGREAAQTAMAMVQLLSRELASDVPF